MSGQYTTLQLQSVQRKIKVLPKYFLQWFGKQINFESDEIAFDKVNVNYRTMAPLVIPTRQGRLIREEGFGTKALRPAYVKPKHAIDHEMILPRQPGEPIGVAQLSNAAKRDRVIAHLLAKHRAMHENRWEWLAAQALIHGGVAIESPDYPASYVDFGRNPEHTMTSNWNATGVTLFDMLADLRLGQRLVADNSLTGTVVRDYVFGGEAWDVFVKVAGKDLFGRDGLMDNNLRGSGTEVTRVWDDVEGVQYMGEIVGTNGNGRMRIWVNTQKLTGDNGKDEYLMPQKGVLGISTAVDGVRCFGAVYDADVGYAAVDYFPKMWKNPDPSVEYLMTQGAPLMVPSDPNATFFLTVTA